MSLKPFQRLSVSYLHLCHDGKNDELETALFRKERRHFIERNTRDYGFSFIICPCSVSRSSPLNWDSICSRRRSANSKFFSSRAFWRWDRRDWSLVFSDAETPQGVVSTTMLRPRTVSIFFSQSMIGWL